MDAGTRIQRHQHGSPRAIQPATGTSHRLRWYPLTCDNFLYVFKGAPAARQPSGPLGRIGRSKRGVIGENA